VRITRLVAVVAVVGVLFLAGHAACSRSDPDLGADPVAQSDAGDARSDRKPERSDAAEPSVDEAPPADAPLEATHRDGDAAPDGGSDAAGAPPIWQPIPNLPAPCGLDLLANPQQVGSPFEWGPCASGIPECEALSPAAPFRPAKDGGIYGYPRVHDDGTDVWIAYATDGTDTGKDYVAYGVVAHIDGRVVAAFRASVPKAPPWCYVAGPALSAGRFAMMGKSIRLPLDGGDVEEGSQFPLLGPLTVAASPAVGQVLETVSVQTMTLGGSVGSRLGVVWVPGDMLASFDHLSGQDYKVIAPIDLDAGGGWGTPIPFPDRFLVDFFSFSAATAWRIMATDGLTYPVQYYAEPDASSVGGVQNLDGQVAWARGIGVIQFNEYTRMELWASPYSADPAKLQPKKVADMPFRGYSGMTRGGWGHYARAPDLDEPTSVHVWSVPDGEHRALAVPKSIFVRDIVGLSREHIWLPAKPSNKPSLDQWIYRVKISAIPIAK
jgi:hypothetical protein